MSNNIPGDLSEREKLESIIRVDHAGEYGAKRIYQGQIDALKDDKECCKILQHMAQQEEEHLKYFDDMIQEEKVRPTALMPVWHALGYALGYGTAKMGKKAAMACTVAVEEAIDEHYQEQIETLGPENKQLKEQIEKFRQEELEHRDIGIANDAESAPGYDLIYQGVRAATKLAIFLSKKI